MGAHFHAQRSNTEMYISITSAFLLYPLVYGEQTAKNRMRVLNKIGI